MRSNSHLISRSTNRFSKMDGQSVTSLKTGKLDKRFRHNWRTDMLAIPKGHVEQLKLFSLSQSEKEKYLQSQQQRSKLRIVASREPPEPREFLEKNRKLEQLAVLPPRFYVYQKKLLSQYQLQNNSKLAKVLDEKLHIARESTYNEYNVAKIRLKKTKVKKPGKHVSGKGRKGGKKGFEKELGKGGAGKVLVKKMTHKERYAEALEHCKKLAKPKRIFKPPKVNRGKLKPINIERLIRLARPMSPIPKYVCDKDAWKTQKWVEPEVLKHRASSWIKKLALPKVMPHQEAKELGLVDPAALTAVATTRVKELAMPKVKVTTIDELNENAFKISNNALKYVATPRILQLAKPIQRK